MKKVTALLIAALSVALLSGCNPITMPVDKGQAQDIVQQLTYVKDKRTGLCFALIGMTKMGDVSQTSTGITYVPCDEKVEKLLINNAQAAPTPANAKPPANVQSNANAAKK